MLFRRAHECAETGSAWLRKNHCSLLTGWCFWDCIWSRTSAETPPAAATTPPATVTVKQPQRAKFPDVDETERRSTQQRILRLARAEYAKNPQSYDKTVLKYSEGFEESWCADFISWVRSEAGAPYQHSTTGYWRIPGVKTLQDYYRTYDAYFAVGDCRRRF